MTHSEPNTNTQKLWPPILLATAVIALITVATRLFNLDLIISGWFYTEGVGFPLKNNLLVELFYRSVPFMVTISLLFFILYAALALIKKIDTKYHRLVLALFISMLVGPGLIVNSVFKDHFGRPRPSQSIEFGGTHQHQPVLEANWGNYGKSFPSGHAAVPISFLVLAFSAKRQGKIRLARQLTAGLLFWYLLVSFARIAAGGHHFTDVLWAGYFSFIFAWLSYYLIERPRKGH